MGYRNYFMLLGTAYPNEIKDLSKQEFIDYARTMNHAGYEPADNDCSEYVNFHEFIKRIGATEVYEFGKYYENAEAICALGRPMFSNEEIQKDMYEDYCPYIVGKEAVLSAIQFYHERIIKHFQHLLYSEEEMKQAYLNGEVNYYDLQKTKEERLIAEVESKISEWTMLRPYSLDEKSDKIVDSWLYEYEIFELVKLLKTVNWNGQCLLFYGY